MEQEEPNIDSFLTRSVSGMYYVILRSDDLLFMSWEGKEKRHFQDVGFAMFPSHKSLFDFSDSGTLCHFLH